MAKLLRTVSQLSLAAALTACGGAGDDAPEGKGEAGPEPNLSAKADAFYWPTENGVVDFGEPAKATFGPDARFHAFDFTLTDQASVSLRTDSENRKRDTVLYLYKQGAQGWGSYIAKNDDDGRYLLSSLSAELEAGSYRALVKGYKVTEKGDFTLTVDCAGAGCSPAVPPGRVADACLFGDVYANIPANPNFEVVASRGRLTAADTFEAGEDAAFIKAVQATMDWAGADTLAAAFDAVDQGEFNYTRLRDVFDGQTYTVIEFGAGDNSVGAVLHADGTVGAEISDGDLWPCTTLEPAGRFDDLTFTETEVPEKLAGIPGLKAAKVGGLDAGKMLSQGSNLPVFLGMTELFDESCTGVPDAQGIDGMGRETGYGWQDFYERESRDWETALGDDDLDALLTWSEDRYEDLEFWSVGLLDNACGGDGAGVLVMIHDRQQQVMLWHIMVEWSE